MRHRLTTSSSGWEHRNLRHAVIVYLLLPVPPDAAGPVRMAGGYAHMVTIRNTPLSTKGDQIEAIGSKGVAGYYEFQPLSAIS